MTSPLCLSFINKRNSTFSQGGQERKLMLEPNKIYLGDCLELMKDMPDKSVDCIITDPPYGIGLDKWDIKIDIETFFQECYRVMTDKSFIAFFGQEPTLFDWNMQARKFFKYREEIVWVKRTSNFCAGLHKMHETIMIYKKGNPVFLNCKGKYTDIKVEGIYFDIMTIEAYKRKIGFLMQKIRGDKNNIKYKKGNNAHDKRYNSLDKSIENKSDIDIHSKEETNFTNVWSFLPEHLSKRGCNKNTKDHATVKPIKLLRRLIELLTNKTQLVLDPFSGSGTTAIACHELNRNFICIEKEEQYYKMSCDRLEKAKQQGRLL